jgi:hypothetical protein
MVHIKWLHSAEQLVGRERREQRISNWGLNEFAPPRPLNRRDKKSSVRNSIFIGPKAASFFLCKARPATGRALQNIFNETSGL